MIKAQLFQGVYISRVIGLAALLFVFSLTLSIGTAQAAGNNGKVKVYESIEGAPKKASVGQLYYNTADNTEYIYNGRIWLPHDKRADEIDYDEVRNDLRKSKEGRK